MKKIVLSFLVLALAVSVRAQDIVIDLQVDMSAALRSCDGLPFNPDSDVVQAMGQYVNNWGNFPENIESVSDCPGSYTPSDTTDFTPLTPGSMIYHKVVTLNDSALGQLCQFKYRIDHNWNNDELRGSGDPACSTSGNRCIQLVSAVGDSTTFTVQDVFAVPGETITYGPLSGKNVKLARVNSIYPNPANGNATLVYTSNAVNGKVQIYLTNLVGQVVKTVFNGTQTEGVHNQKIDVSSLANGVYFLTLKVNDQSVARKFNVMN
jgi:hypothetical protein